MNIYWAWLIRNCVSVIAWVVLAIVFHKWWIALFAIFFITNLKSDSDHCRICDKCGKRSPVATNYNEAIDKAIKDGWVHKRSGDEWIDLCPDCQKIINFNRNKGEYK